MRKLGQSSSSEYRGNLRPPFTPTTMAARALAGKQGGAPGRLVVSAHELRIGGADLGGAAGGQACERKRSKTGRNGVP